MRYNRNEYQTPTQKLKSGFLMLISQGIGSTFISLLIIFQALQSEILRFNFYSLCSKIPKIPEFTLVISKQSTCCKASKRCFKYSFDDKKFICGYKKVTQNFLDYFLDASELKETICQSKWRCWLKCHFWLFWMFIIRLSIIKILIF